MQHPPAATRLGARIRNHRTIGPGIGCCLGRREPPATSSPVSRSFMGGLNVLERIGSLNVCLPRAHLTPSPKTHALRALLWAPQPSGLSAEAPRPCVYPHAEAGLPLTGRTSAFHLHTRNMAGAVGTQGAAHAKAAWA